MHYSLNIALLLFSLVFGSVALFTICTCVPKTSKGINDPAMEDAWVDTLSLVPIRRRSDTSQDSIDLPDGTTKHGSDTVRPIRAYPISRLLQSERKAEEEEDEKKEKAEKQLLKKRSIGQHISLVDPASNNAGTLSQKIRNQAWNQLLTTMDLYKRNTDSSPTHTHSFKSGSQSHLDKEPALIDFDKAHRDADLAGLIPGFLIETEYLTPARKTVQLIPKDPDHELLDSDVDSTRQTYDSTMLNDVAIPAIWTAQDVVGSVLDHIDDQELTPFIREGFSISHQPDSPYLVSDEIRSPSAVIHLSFPHYDLVR